MQLSLPGINESAAAAVTSVVSDSVWPHRQQPTRLPRPWDSPGKNTGVGCHFLLQCMKVKSENEGAQSCPTLSVLPKLKVQTVSAGLGLGSRLWIFYRIKLLSIVIIFEWGEAVLIFLNWKEAWNTLKKKKKPRRPGPNSPRWCYPWGASVTIHSHPACQATWYLCFLYYVMLSCLWAIIQDFFSLSLEFTLSSLITPMILQITP